jgi:hypothetical protein
MKVLGEKGLIEECQWQPLIDPSWQPLDETLGREGAHEECQAHLEPTSRPFQPRMVVKSGREAIDRRNSAQNSL